jgi:L-rhamnose-H+ transport protein
MVFALVVLPLAVTSMTIPNLSVVYHSTAAEHNSRSLWRWCRMGVAPVSLSLLDMIGIALVFSIVLGTAAAIGSLIPMVTLHREPLKSAAGYAVLGANALVLVSVTLCAAAEKLREGPSMRSTTSQKTDIAGPLLSILCGLLASFMNFGVVFSTPLAQVARSFGARGLNSINAIWLPLMLAGAVPNVLYCAWLMS